MFHFRMTHRLAVLTYAAMLVAVVASPAKATDGRTAVGMCIDSTASGARCEWSVNDKGEIDICNKSGCVYCPSATADCSVAARSRPHPTRPLPVGTIVRTGVLNVQISSKPFSGSLLGFRCQQGFLMCPGHGCQPKDDKCFPIE
jgi:hypothetical protein